MASSSYSKIMEIPKFFLFSEGGIYSGGKYDKSFNYKIVPSKSDDNMTVYIWFGKNCIDKSENVESKVYPLTEEGHADAVRWIEETYLAAPLTDDYPPSFFGEGVSVIP